MLQAMTGFLRQLWREDSIRHMAVAASGVGAGLPKPAAVALIGFIVLFIHFKTASQMADSLIGTLPQLTMRESRKRSCGLVIFQNQHQG